MPVIAVADDYTNNSSNLVTIQNGTEISGNLNQNAGTLYVNGVTVDGIMNANAGVIATSPVADGSTGVKVGSLAGAGNISLGSPGIIQATPSPDSNSPYVGEMVITNGQNQNFSGNIQGNGVVTLVDGSQTFSGTVSNTGTFSTRNGTITVNGNGNITAYSTNSTASTVDVGLSYSDNGHLIVDGPNASITNEILSVGNGDKTYGAGTTMGTSDATFKNGASLNDSQAGNVIVGNWQHGILNVESGSSVTPFKLSIGGDPGSTGVVNLTDKNSTITAVQTFIGASGTGTLNITNNAVYTSTGIIAFGYHGAASTSSGTLNVTNGGVLQATDYNNNGTMLSGINVYAGTKTSFNVDNGTIQTYQANNLTSKVDVNIKDSATFDAEGTAIINWNAGISGTGDLHKIGSGVMNLNGNNTYTGGTYVDYGIFSLNSNSSLANSAGLYIGKMGLIQYTETNSPLVIKSLATEQQAMMQLGMSNITITDGNATFGNVVNSSIQTGGGVNITGGMEIFKGDNYYFGQTNISNATLEIDGNQKNATADTNVFDNGVLQGTGLVGGNVNVTNGTIIAGLPNEEQTLNIKGDLHLGGASTTVVYGNDTVSGTGKVNGSTKSILSSGMLSVGGTAYLGGTLSVIAPKLTKDEAYRVLSAKSLSGTYAGLTTNQTYAFLTPTITYDTDNNQNYVDISLVQTSIDYASLGKTGNEKAVGKALNNLPSDNPIITTLMNTQIGQERHILNNLSGEIHSSVRTGLIEDSQLIENAVMNRMANIDCDGPNAGQSTYDLNIHKKHACDSDHTILWGQAYGSLGHNDGNSNASSMSHNTAGFIIGADTLVRGTKWRVGGFAAYGHSMFDVGGRQSSARSDNVTIGGYGTRNWGSWRLRAGASYTWNVINTRRNIMGGFGKSNSGYMGGTAQAFAELGYKKKFGKHVVEPFINATYVNMNTDGFKENGIAGLKGKSMNTSTVFTSAGIRYNTQFNVGKMIFQPHVMAAYRHAVGGMYGKANMRFASGGSDMGITGVALSSNSAIIGAGMSAKVTDRVAVDLSYYGQFGNRSMDNGITGSFKYSF